MNKGPVTIVCYGGMARKAERERERGGDRKDRVSRTTDHCEVKIRMLERNERV